jgi:cysteinyl-tRNA synthetase
MHSSMLSLFQKKDTETKKPDLVLYSTETRELAFFIPKQAPHVTMYSCGPTVYDFVHIGNLRSYVFADILKHTLKYNGYTVNHTINLTDFGHLTDDADAGEDKMMKGLKREGKPVTLAAMRELSDTYIAAFKADIKKLRIEEPTTFSRASDYIREQIDLVKTLEEKGYTYETSDGVYFDITKFPAYGRLGHIDVTKLRAGARVEENPEKRHPADFAVWKKGLLGWDSRWGKGFPGWHIECSAMAMATLGKEIDIHTGGIDHIHTHHNAEIAQSECATGKQFVRYWLHNEFVTIDNGKIGKSLGNAITMRQLEDAGFSGDDYRYFLLTAHYRSPINFTFDALKAAKQALFRLKRYIYEEYNNAPTTPHLDYLARFHAHINHDLDTPQAIALLFEVTKDDRLTAGEKCATMQAMDEVLNIGLRDARDSGLAAIGVMSHDEIPQTVKELMSTRDLARTTKNWAESDRLRAEINLHGYTVEDTPHGTKVSKAS